MSHGQRNLLIWAVIIGVIAYAADINLGHVISGFFSALQQMHNSNAH